MPYEFSGFPCTNFRFLPMFFRLLYEQCKHVAHTHIWLSVLFSALKIVNVRFYTFNPSALFVS